MEKRLAGLERAVARIEVQVGVVQDKQMEMAAMLKEGLHGTGDSPGLVVRVDRVEGWKRRTTKITATLIGAFTILAAGRVWELVTGPA